KAHQTNGRVEVPIVARDAFGLVFPAQRGDDIRLVGDGHVRVLVVPVEVAETCRLHRQKFDFVGINAGDMDSGYSHMVEADIHHRTILEDGEGVDRAVTKARLTLKRDEWRIQDRIAGE